MFEFVIDVLKYLFHISLATSSNFLIARIIPGSLLQSEIWMSQQLPPLRRKEMMMLTSEERMIETVER